MSKQQQITAADVWGSAGAAYEAISLGLNDAITHAVQALWPMPGERVLDIGTGTGRAARMAAELGAEVEAIDISPDLITAAEALSKGHPNAPRYHVADAMALPFEDAHFDGVVSTFGVMFAPDPQSAAAEIARVLRPGGRLALATWAPEPNYITAFFDLVASHSGAPAPPANPMDWGDPAWLKELFGDGFDLACTPQDSTLYAPDGQALWEKYSHGFGPVKVTADALDAAGRAAFRDAFIALHAPYASGLGLRIPRRALLVEGRRR